MSTSKRLKHQTIRQIKHCDFILNSSQLGLARLLGRNSNNNSPTTNNKALNLQTTIATAEQHNHQQAYLDFKAQV